MIRDDRPRQEPRIGIFFTWRTAILRSDLPPTTRHVLLTLSCFMNEGGEGAFPSQRTLAEQTGLGYSTVREHLTKASELGWIEKRTRARENGAQSTNFYQATVPDEVRARLRSEPTPPASSRQGALPAAGRGPASQPAGGPASQPAGGPASQPAGGVISSGSTSSVEDENTHVAEDGDVSAGKAPSEEQIRELHDHFNQERRRHDPTRRDLKLTDDRRRKYRARLRTWSVDELKRAISNALADPFYRGKNGSSARYDHPETVLKNDGAVDRHLDVGEGKQQEQAARRREAGRGVWGTVVSYAKRDIPEEEIREQLSPAAREAYLAVRSDLETALVEDGDLRRVRERFLEVYSATGARGP